MIYLWEIEFIKYMIQKIHLVIFAADIKVFIGPFDL